MQGTPKAIQIQGIVRNATVIGAQDGQAEDLINLRFMDGSWRASGDGRLVYTMSGTQYTQLYVHTNVYHHLLGVNNGTLYWFAEIGTDGTTFYPLDGTTSRTAWPQDMQTLPTSPVALTTVVGDIWITQNGHLLTIIDENDDFEYFVFKTGEDAYHEVKVDVNGEATDRKLFPFGTVNFNLLSGETDDYKYSDTDENQYIQNDTSDINYSDSTACIPKTDEATTHAAAQIWHAQMLKVFNDATKANRFTSPFLIIAAAKLYDGSYAYATQPVLLHPREKVSDDFSTYANMRNGLVKDLDHTTTVAAGAGGAETCYDVMNYGAHSGIMDGTSSQVASSNDPYPVFTSGAASADVFSSTTFYISGAYKKNPMQSVVIGSDIALSIENVLPFIRNKDVFSGLSIFITPQSFLFDMSEEGYKEGEVRCASNKKQYNGGGYTLVSNASYFPKRRTMQEIMYELMHSPFYLLREYSVNELEQLQSEIKIDMSEPQYEGVLQNITQQKRLDYEATNRTTYLPKVSYMYNGRLHIANYKSYPFFGYPIDLFHLHNHSVKVQANSWFKGVLPNLADNNDAYLQYAKTSHNFPSTIPSGCTYFAFIEVTIDSSQGEQKVVRYIEPYAVGNGQNGRADFIESLNPLITYPDARAKHIKIVRYVGGSQYGNARKVEFDLKPHPYLNMAYYIDPDLKPISLSATGAAQISTQTLPMMVNTEEYFPNGLKVSKTDNPMFFPVENAYQVGSAEILAIMSNAVPIGTGQTGAAPLLEFCKDGVYAHLVDASGQMVYTNATIVGRDVCNNPRSVTPIDGGIAFTTDRGLMMATYDGKNFKIEEIGAPAEGDVLHYTNVNAQGQPLSVEGSKIATDALTKIAGLPSSLCDTTDFLTYLQDKGTSGKAAIVNYNHNMRELIISNPNYAYSYVLDREGNWSRRDYTAAEYVNNYPTSYRVTSDGKFYKLDDEGDASTSLEHRKEADNQIFYLSNVIKLDSIGFKQAYRFVVRGYFETMFTGQDMITGTIDDRKIIVVGLSIDNMGIGEVLRMAYLHIYGMDAWVSVSEYGEVGNILTLEIYDALTLENITKTFRPTGMPGEYITLIKRETTERPAMACVVEGSYDGIKFAPLGFNRKSGKFTNIGCHVSHTDVRFYRVILCGQVTGKTRINYMELSAVGSKLNTKIR